MQTSSSAYVSKAINEHNTKGFYCNVIILIETPNCWYELKTSEKSVVTVGNLRIVLRGTPFNLRKFEGIS